MSDDDKIPGGSPIPQFDDIVEFLSKRATKPCPSCGYNKWSLSEHGRGSAGMVGSGLAGIKLTTGETLLHGVPMILTTCSRCAFVRMHGLFEISKWIQAGKPEFRDE